MDIEHELEDLKSWASKSNVLFTEGSFEQKRSAIVEFPYSGQDSVQVFKQAIEKLDIRLVIYELVHFDENTYEILEETIEYIDDEDIKEKFEQIKCLQNRYLGYTVYFFNNGIAFKIENYIEECNDFLEVKDAVYDFIEENNSKFKSLPQEKVVEFGMQLALHENYSKMKNRIQRVNLAEQLFNKKFNELSVNSYYGVHLVVAQAETYFETVIKPKKEKELKQKIQELKNKGWTKVKIAAELGISKDTLNKYI